MHQTTEKIGLNHLPQMLKKYLLSYPFIYKHNSYISECLIFYCKQFGNVTLTTLTINKNFKNNSYYITFKYYYINKKSKQFQFTFDENFKIKSKQQSKYLKLQDDIQATFEKSLLNLN